MALQFRQRKPNRILQYTLAFSALFIVASLVIFWALIRHRGTTQPSPSDTASTPTQEPTFTVNDKGNLLCVIANEQTARFYILQSDPMRCNIHIMAIPQDVTVANGKTLLTTYREDGIVKTTGALAAALNLPLKHYISASPANVSKWLGRVQNRLPLTLNESITYTDEHGIKIVLPSGDINATASQSATLLHYSDETGTAVLASLLNNNLHSKRNFSNDFSSLCNHITTDLRIDNFTSYRSTLTYLAEKNDKSIGNIVTLPTQSAGDVITIDTAALNATVLYY